MQRIGDFSRWCGSNIAATVDVEIRYQLPIYVFGKRSANYQKCN